MHEQPSQQSNLSVSIQLQPEESEDDLSYKHRFDVIQLPSQLQKQLQQQQTNANELRHSPKLAGLINSKKYPGNCLFEVISYFKLRSQQPVKNEQKEYPVKNCIRQEGFGTLVSKNLIISCAHNLVNKISDKYENQPYKIQVRSATQFRIITKSYLIIDKYRDNNKNVSSQNDVSLLYFNQDIRRDKYICVGVVEDLTQELIAIPKVEPDRIVYYNEKQPTVNRNRSTNIKYHIRTSPGDSGSPIIIVKDSNFRVYYLIGLHRAKVTQMQSHNEGIVFNQRMIKRIIQLESKLIEDANQRQIVKNSVKLSCREKILQQQCILFSALFSPEKSSQIANIDTNNHKIFQVFGLEPISMYENEGIVQQHSYRIQLHTLLNPQFQELTLEIARIHGEEQAESKLVKLQRFLKRKFKQPANSYIENIIYEIYQKVHLILKSKSDRDIKFQLRQVNEIVDELQMQQVMAMQCRNPKMLQEEAQKQSVFLVSANVAYVLRRMKYFPCLKQNLKLLLYNFALPWKEANWFGLRTKFKTFEQLQLEFAQYVTNLGINQNKPTQFFLDIFSRTQALNLNIKYEQPCQIQRELKRLAPYEALQVFAKAYQNYYMITITYNIQTNSALAQAKDILKFYHGCQSAVVNLKQSIIDYVSQQQKFAITTMVNMNLQVKEYYCKSFDKINYDTAVRAIDSAPKLTTLIANITDQLLILHSKGFSLCCPLEFAMVANLPTLEVAFFYIGHPDLLVSFINRSADFLEQLTEYYPVEQIIELAREEPRRFRKIDVWMYAKSLLRFLDRLQVPEITESSYFAHLRELFQGLLAPINSRKRLKQVKTQLKRLSGQH